MAEFFLKMSRVVVGLNTSARGWSEQSNGWVLRYIRKHLYFNFSAHRPRMNFSWNTKGRQHKMKRKKTGKVCFYIALYPGQWISQSALHFPHDRTVHSNTNSASPGSILVMQQLRHEDYRLIFPPTGTHDLYSWVNWGIVERTKMLTLRNGSKGDSNPDSLDWDTGILRLSYRAPQHKTEGTIDDLLSAAMATWHMSLSRPISSWSATVKTLHSRSVPWQPVVRYLRAITAWFTELF